MTVCYVKTYCIYGRKGGNVLKETANFTVVHCCNCSNLMKLYETSNGRKSGQCPVCKTVVCTSYHNKK